MIETMWVIVNDTIGLYCGSNELSKADAIERHTRDVGRTWEECEANGDSAHEAEITVFNMPSPKH